MTDTNDTTTATQAESIFDKWTSHCLENDASPASLTAIQSDAKAHFENLLLLTNENDDAAHPPSKELAQLIAKLGPAISSQSSSKLCALNYLLGSLEGICNDVRVGVALPFKMMQLVSNFLLEHCGPIQESNLIIDDDFNDEEMESTYASIEDVRDAALKCISALMKISIDADETTRTSTSTLDQCVAFRIHLAQKAVRKRCATLADCDDDDSDDEDMEDDDNAGPSEQEAKTLSGLSLLPRAKRSLCFRTLESTVHGIQKDITQIPTTQCSSKELIHFVTFAATCLHGETDPRCLMQMLQLMKQVQVVIAPIVENGNDGGLFPYTAIFDAAAVYYPVRFTPPSNDPHGITREGITFALMQVLTCSTLFGKGISSQQQQQEPDATSMTVLASGLFLERMSPPGPSSPYGDDDDDDAAQDVSTVKDRIDALDDLKSLLLVPLENNTNGASEQAITANTIPARTTSRQGYEHVLNRFSVP